MTPYGIVPWAPITDGALARMTGAAAKVYTAICAHVRAKTWECSLGITRLMKLTGFHERAVFGALADLKAMGLILEVKAGGGRGRITTWRLVENPAPQCTVSDVETLHGEAVNPAPPRQETLHGDARPIDKNNSRTLKKGGASASPSPAESTNGAGGRLLGLFCESFKAKVGEGFAGNKPALGRFLKVQAGSIGEQEAESRIRRWFGASRNEYDGRLLMCRWQAAELRADAVGCADDPLAVAGGAMLAQELFGSRK